MASPQWVLDLKIRRANITRELAKIDNNEGGRTEFGSKPDHSGEAGGTQHTDYRRSLLQELREINQTIREAADTIVAEEAAENPGDFTFYTSMDS